MAGYAPYRGKAPRAEGCLSYSNLLFVFLMSASGFYRSSKLQRSKGKQLKCRHCSNFT